MWIEKLVFPASVIYDVVREQKGEQCHGDIINKGTRINQTLPESADVLGHVDVMEELSTRRPVKGRLTHDHRDEAQEHVEG